MAIEGHKKQAICSKNPSKVKEMQGSDARIKRHLVPTPLTFTQAGDLVLSAAELKRRKTHSLETTGELEGRSNAEELDGKSTN